MLKVKVLSIEDSLYEGDASAVFLPDSKGEFEVLPHHARLLAALTEGPIRIRKEDGSMEIIKIKSGFAQVENDSVTICVEL